MFANCVCSAVAIASQALFAIHSHPIPKPWPSVALQAAIGFAAPGIFIAAHGAHRTINVAV